MDRPALLDVNVLIALFDSEHVHPELAHDWFSDNRRDGWATCPVTENGFLRVLSSPAYRSALYRLPDLMVRLRTFCGDPHHRFWPDTVSFRDASLFDPGLIGGHRQLTDIYLLGLAMKKDGCLVTFDRAIPVKAVIGADTGTLTVVAPAS